MIYTHQNRYGKLQNLIQVVPNLIYSFTFSSIFIFQARFFLLFLNVLAKKKGIHVNTSKAGS